MNQDHDLDLDQELARLKSATDAIGPRRDFAMRVQGAIARAPRKSAYDWQSNLRAPARAMIPVAAFAALISLFFAAKTASAFEDAVVDTYEGTDATW